ncbi:pheA operon leader peptide PheL [Yersinia ruckeri]|nr:pheA operon leader peptide PheL [Yersinia ruckeri]EKN3347732.1 pheA operon leader peptide PheL [Yersinia ruckeri]EKN3363016.1 pheA operon leader peptide PheL [Yersinia ruckeri]EKN4182966.1 pheA operon leader peptide PheL [Yersinia ruckeri]EKN4199842.1 pheA operon leader peptide PheL [Yersinia ruckeri]EKN4202755.1 pheA operon leader peptide PheL [Yersinia ruckeri]
MNHKVFFFAFFFTFP